MESSQVSKNSADGVDTAHDDGLTQAKLSFVNLLYLFVGALMIRLWFNFATDHLNSAFASDASEYLRYTEALSKLNWFAPVFGPEWKEFVITGPVFPFFLWFCSLVTFTQVSAANVSVFLAGHSIVSALTVAGITLIANNLWGRRTALTAGFMAAFYPAFIVNSGRLYSESFATFIEVAALVILTNTSFIEKVRGKRVWLYGLLGVLLIVLQLTRSSMILLTGAAFVFVFAAASKSFKITWRPALVNCAVLAAGCAAMLAPWLIFEKMAFDKMTLVVDRVGHYNLFVGTNSNIQGFLSYPYPDGRGIEKKSFLQLTKEAYKQSPSRFIKLMLDKPARLYKFPWNDFRTAIGPISFKLQVAYHQFVILLAIVGITLGLFFKPADREQQWLGKLALLSTFVLNLPFLLFITVPRYNLMAMPALIILAAAGIQALVWLLRKQSKARAPKMVALSALFLFVFLRDDLRSPISFGDNAATLYFVQGTDLLTRSLLGTIAALAMLAGLWLSLNLLSLSTRNREIGRVLVALLAVSLLPLTLFPQRANGRQQEGIITLARPGETLGGEIRLPPGAVADSDTADWYLMIDSDLGQVPRDNLAITVNGKPLNAPAMPALAALDDWHYLKFHQNSAADGYLECGYIFDCLSREAALNNIDMRQWYLLPLSKDFFKPADTVTVELKQQKTGKTSIYSAPDHPDNRNKKEAKQLIPSRAVYSWEKTFYGVENDEGLTCPRYDEVIAKRQAQWKIGFENKSEALPIDLNVRLVKVKSTASGADSLTADRNIDGSGSGGADSNRASGNTRVTLALPTQNLSGDQLAAVAVNLEYPDNNRIDANFPAQMALAPPALALEWTSKDNKQSRLSLPWLARPAQKLNVLIPLDLKKIEGSDFKIICTSGDKDCRIGLSSHTLKGHPLFSVQELY